MGHDIIDFRGRHVLASDSVLELLRHFALAEIAECTRDALRCDEDTLRALDAYFRGWNWMCPGVVTGLALDPLIDGDARRIAPLRLLLPRVRGRIDRFGDAIPLAYLKRHLNQEDHYYMGDTPTRFVLELINAIQELLSENAA